MIRLQFLRGRELDSRLIEWFSHSGDFSHVDTVLPDGRLLGARSDHVGGAEPGVQIRDPRYLEDTPAIRIELPCEPQVERDYLQFVTSQIGKPYDSEGILAFVAGRDWNDPQAWFCSELVAAGLQIAGFFPYRLATPSNKITPADLVLLLSGIVPVTL